MTAASAVTAASASVTAASASVTSPRLGDLRLGLGDLRLGDPCLGGRRGTGHRHGVGLRRGAVPGRDLHLDRVRASRERHLLAVLRRVGVGNRRVAAVEVYAMPWRTLAPLLVGVGAMVIASTPFATDAV